MFKSPIGQKDVFQGFCSILNFVQFWWEVWMAREMATHPPYYATDVRGLGVNIN